MNTAFLGMNKVYQDKLLLFIASRYGVTRQELFSRRGGDEVVWARWTLWALVRFGRKASFASIAYFFGKDHSTILYGLRRFHELCEIDKNCSADWIAAKREFRRLWKDSPATPSTSRPD